MNFFYQPLALGTPCPSKQDASEGSGKSAASSVSVGSDAISAGSSGDIRAGGSGTTTAAASANGAASEWELEDFGPSLGFRSGRRAQLGDFQLVVTSTEAHVPESIPAEVIAFLLKGAP